MNDEGPSKGAANSPITVVEFADFQCPYCREERATLDQLMRAYPDKVRLVFKQLPLPSHPG
ncbi:MAG: thioredoxin domain-containing protein [Blastocatellia bacterium]